MVPQRVKELLKFSGFSFVGPMVPVYKLSRLVKMDGVIKDFLLPAKYKKEIEELDVA